MEFRDNPLRYNFFFCAKYLAWNYCLVWLIRILRETAWFTWSKSITHNFSKSIIKTLETGAWSTFKDTIKTAERHHWHSYDIHSLLTLNIFHTFVKGFYPWFWTSKSLLEMQNISKNSKLETRLITENSSPSSWIINNDTIISWKTICW